MITDHVPAVRLFLLITHATSWLRLSRREEAWKTAEISILRPSSPYSNGGSRAARAVWDLGR
jgi:hypothetical protein